MVESAGRALDGSAFKEKKLAVYQARRKKGAALGIEIRELQNKAGVRSVAITLEDYPVMTLRCSAPDEAGEVYFISLEYLGGNVSGWNEYTLDLSGAGKLALGATEAILSVPAPPEPVAISAGRLRRYDTRVTGDEALAVLRNRRERIIVLVEWMRGREGVPAFDDAGAFADYWKPLLFPEINAGRKRPGNWKQEGDVFARAADISWNTSYSARLLGEALRPVRDSGTLLRDWEEALNWIYLEYQWEHITQSLAGEITVPRKK
jgi:hypothetical protein